MQTLIRYISGWGKNLYSLYAHNDSKLLAWDHTLSSKDLQEIVSLTHILAPELIQFSTLTSVLYGVLFFPSCLNKTKCLEGGPIQGQMAGSLSGTRANRGGDSLRWREYVSSPFESQDNVKPLPLQFQVLFLKKNYCPCMNCHWIIHFKMVHFMLCEFHLQINKKFYTIIQRLRRILYIYIYTAMEHIWYIAEYLWYTALWEIQGDLSHANKNWDTFKCLNMH